MPSLVYLLAGQSLSRFVRGPGDPNEQAYPVVNVLATGLLFKGEKATTVVFWKFANDAALTA
jgi:hypothetical protein